MSLIPQHFIDEVLARTDIVDVIEPRLTLKKKGTEYSACCPFHNEKTPSFTVSQTKQFYHCFGCGQHGTAIGFLMEHDHLSFIEAIETLAELNSMEIPRESRQNQQKQDDLKPIYAALTDAQTLFTDQLSQHPPAQEYLKQRGLNGTTAKQYGIGFAIDSWNSLLNSLKTKHLEKTLIAAGLLSENEQGRVYDKFRDRIMFPIRDRRGRPIAFGGRVMGDGTPKYLNSPETKVFHKGNTLYGLYEARQHAGRLDTVLVVEGYMDCVALGQFGITNTVATLGTAVTKEHLQQLMRVVKHIVICFDGDRAGRKAAKRALEQSMHVLKDGMRIDFMFLPDGEDPDSLVQKTGADGFRELIEQATPLSSYMMQSLQAENSKESAEGRTLIAMEARALLKPLNPAHAKLLKKQLLDEISKITQTDLQDLDAGGKSPSARRPQRIRSHNRQRQLEMTAMRQAIAVILQQPNTARLINDDLLVKLDPIPGGTLLGEIVDICREQPAINSAILLENFRDTSHFESLQQLSAWSPPVSDLQDEDSVEDPDKVTQSDLSQLLGDAITQLEKQHVSARIEQLAQLESSTGLSDREKTEMKHLLMLRT